MLNVHDISQKLDECVALFRSAPINDDMRLYLTNQSHIFALFLSDLEANRISPDQLQDGTVPSMLELISEYCEQVSATILHEAA